VSYVLRMITTTHDDYLSRHHKPIFFVIEMQCVYCEVGNGFLRVLGWTWVSQGGIIYP